MKSPRIQTFKILRNACDMELKELVVKNNIHTIGVPESEIKENNLPLVRINSMRNNPDDFASNNPLTYEQMVAIYVWDTDSDKLDQIAQIVEELMESNDWVLYRNFDIVEDTETDGWYMLHHRYRTTKLNM